MSSGQLDCPWCGCGWLIPCLTCRKSFTFAEVREMDIPLIEVGRREVVARGLTNVSEEEIAEWAEGMAEALDEFEVGDVVVYLDGHYWKRDAVNIVFGGYYVTLSLKRLPHAEALSDPALLDRVLGDKAYWLTGERPARETPPPLRKERK